jgi:hypothetical protein
MRGRQQKDAEALRDVVLHPLGELGRTVPECLDGGSQAAFGLDAVGSVEDDPQSLRDLAPHAEPGYVAHGVALQVELAALPRHVGHAGLERRLEPFVTVARDELDTVHPAILEFAQKFAPMDFGFGELDADTEDGALAVLANADRDEHGAAHDRASVADLFVAGVEDQVLDSPDGALPPCHQLLVQRSGSPRHLRGRDIEPTQLARHLSDTTRGNSLHVHLGDGQLERPFAADAAFERGRVEALGTLGQTADLRYAEVDLADASGDPLGLEAVREAAALLRALVGAGLEERRAFQLHGLVHEDLQRAGHVFEAVIGEEFQGGVEGGRIGLVVRHRFSRWLLKKSTRKTAGARHVQLLDERAALRLRFGSLRSPPLRRKAARRPRAKHPLVSNCELQKERYAA